MTSIEQKSVLYRDSKITQEMYSLPFWPMVFGRDYGPRKWRENWLGPPKTFFKSYPEEKVLSHRTWEELQSFRGRLYPDEIEGVPLANLLRIVIKQGIYPAYVGKLQASFMPSVREGKIPSQALIDPLTGRELEVLKLMATGLSNREIAAELIVALGTVAKYSNNIFTKLNVRNRTEAISRAGALDLL